MERARTGIKGLDEILEGGFPRPASVLITGDIGTKKNTLAQRILYEGLVSGEKGIYITIDLFPDDIIENMQRFNMNVEPFIKSGDLIFIDGFSPRVGIETKAEFIVENPFSADELLKTLAFAEKRILASGKKYRLVMSHLSTVMYSLPRRRLHSFIERLHAEAKRSGAIYVLVYSEGVLDIHSENLLKSLPDVVLKLYRGRERRYLEILRCVKTRYKQGLLELSQDVDEVRQGTT